MDGPTAIALKDTIFEALENSEPRALIKNVELFPDYDRNAYLITIVFSIINIPEDITFNFFLNRAR